MPSWTREDLQGALFTDLGTGRAGPLPNISDLIDMPLTQDSSKLFGPQRRSLPSSVAVQRAVGATLRDLGKHNLTI